MAVTAYKAAGTAETVDRDGKALWTNYDYAKTDNESFAYCEVAKITYGDWLRLTNFGFTTSDIPEDSTIDGIEVQYKREAVLADRISDSVLKLRETAGQVGDDKASAVKWAISKETVTYGGAADTWNSGLTDSDIRDSGFGIDLSALNSGELSNHARIYFCQIRVYYTAPAGEDHEKALSDTVTISDSIAKAIELNKADTAAITDTLGKAIGLIKIDVVAIADTIVKAVGLVKADTVTIADTIAKLISLVKADAVTINDTFARIVNYARSLADNVGITDSISKAMSIVKVDTMVITDIMATVIGKIINLFDTVIITDSLEGVIRVKTYLKQAIARVQVKGMNIARMQVKRMNIAKTHLFR